MAADKSPFIQIAPAGERTVRLLAGPDPNDPTEAERYCVRPGQATSYMVGQTQWLKLRAMAQQRMGAKFDIRGFHDRALSASVIPLSVLETVMEEWATG